MGRRYPGSLIARVMVNRYYALRKKYSKPKTAPGRLDFVKTWFLNWDGLIIGGVFVGGLGWTAVKLYLNERMDDIGRRAERVKLYQASCNMAQANLQAIQASLEVYSTLMQYAAPRSELQQQWQQHHQHRMHLAQERVQLWQGKAAYWLPNPAAAPNSQDAQGSTAHHLEQEYQQSVLQGDTGISNTASLLHKQVAQQLPQQGVQQPQQQGSQQQGEQSQQSSEPQQQASLCQHQQQQDKVHHQQRVSYNPIQWYCATRLRQAQLWLLDEQHAAAQAERGAKLWEYVGQNATQQVERLQQQEERQLLRLLEHTYQLQSWMGLEYSSGEIDLWFDLPHRLTSWWYHSPAQQDQMGHAGGTGQAAAQPAGQMAVETPASNLEHQQGPAAGWLAALRHRLGGLTSSSHPTREASPHSTAAGPLAGHDSHSSSLDHAAAADPVQAAGAGSSSAGASRYIRFRLLLPTWIPAKMEERDFDLLCRDYLLIDTGTTEGQPAAGGSKSGDAISRGAVQLGGSGQSDPPPHAGPAASGGSEGGADGAEEEEVELDAGWVLLDVFEEALDAVQDLWEAVEDVASG